MRLEQRFKGDDGVSWVDSGEEHSRQREHSKSHVRGAANRLLTGREMVVRKEEEGRKRGQRHNEAGGALQPLM